MASFVARKRTAGAVQPQTQRQSSQRPSTRQEQSNPSYESLPGVAKAAKMQAKAGEPINTRQTILAANQLGDLVHDFKNRDKRDKAMYTYIEQIYKHLKGDRIETDDDSQRFIGNKIKPALFCIIVCICILMIVAGWFAKNDPERFKPNTEVGRILLNVTLSLQVFIMICLLWFVRRRYLKMKTMDFETAVGTLFCAGMISML